MSGNVVLEPDEQPARWVDTCDVLGERTADEQALGNALGASIDTTDDEDAGVASFGAGDGAEFERALAKARALKAVLLAHGVPEVSIELQSGRPSPHGVWDALFVVSEFSHHTVSERSDGLTPVLALCKRGRSDVPGPLCNGYGGWDLCYRILTFGYGNHPGAGGPLTVPALSGGTFTIPRDSARRYAWGTEWEGGIRSSEWDHALRNPRTGARMTMREFMGRSNAALRAYHRIIHHAEHSTWTSRKIDRRGYTAATGTAELLRYQMEEDDMPFTESELRAIVREESQKAAAAAVREWQIKLIGGEETLPVGRVLRRLERRSRPEPPESDDE
jgi:hypothetical protein